MQLADRSTASPDSDDGNAIEHATAKGAALHIETDRPHPKDWRTLTVDTITPADVARWISLAIQKGWDPKTAGPMYRITLNDPADFQQWLFKFPLLDWQEILRPQIATLSPMKPNCQNSAERTSIDE